MPVFGYILVCLAGGVGGIWLLILFCTFWIFCKYEFPGLAAYLKSAAGFIGGKLKLGRK